LADAPGNADEIAFIGFAQPVAQLAKNRNAVPMWIGFPVVAIAAILVGSDRDMGDILGGVDLADSPDDVKFCDVLHGLSPDCVRACPDGHGRVARCPRASQKTEAPPVETVGAKRRLFACGHKGSGPRPSVCRSRAGVDASRGVEIRSMDLSNSRSWVGLLQTTFPNFGV
jgi:hypothetical protein